MTPGNRRPICSSTLAAALLVGSMGTVDSALEARQPPLESAPGTQGRPAPAGDDRPARTAPDRSEILEFRSLMDKGHYASAETLGRALVAQAEAAHGPDSLEAAESLDLLIEALWREGKLAEDEARELAERATALKEKAPRATEPSLATSLFHLAVSRSASDAHAEAKPLFERALTIRERSLGPEHPDVALTLNVYGGSRRKAGDYVEARRLIERGLEIREKALGPSHLSVAGSLNDLASLQHEMYDYDSARSLVERALAIWEKNLGPDHPRVALGVLNLGILHAEQKDLAAATPLLERALAIYDETLGAEHPAVALAVDSLANALVEVGDFVAARPLQERALAIREKAFGPEHTEVAVTLLNLAGSSMEMGDYAAARPLYQRATDITEKIAGSEHPLMADCLFSKAVLYARMGETDEALELALRTDAIGRDNVRLASRTLAEREALIYASGRPPGLDLALTLMVETAVKTPASRRAAWDALVRSRSLVFDEMAARHRSISGSEDPRIGRLAEELTSARELLAKLVVRGPDDESTGQYRALVDQARTEKERAERALAERSAPFRSEQARSQLGLDEVAAALPSDSTLLAFARYRRHSLGVGQRSGRSQEPVPSYLAFVLRSGELEPTLVSIGTVAEIDALVSPWRERIEREAMSLGRDSRRSEAAYRAAGVALRQRIWEPLEPHVAGARRLFVVPDGVLHFVNLAALPVGRDRYLLETGPVLHYLSTERDLVVRDPIRMGEGLLAVGAPAFDDASSFTALAPPIEPTTLAATATGPLESARRAYRGPRSACGSFASMSFESLPAASLETDEIAGIWNATELPTDALAATGAAPVQRRAARILTGVAASEAAVKEQSGGNRILHLATHGFYLGGRCTSALDPTGASTPLSGAENPLLLAGLALAGANHRGAASVDEEDGILTAEEVGAIDLDGVDWAVLSACETGAGELKASEGVFGLRRAFQVAGARTVITSLWEVEDASTRAWMTTLYRNRLTRKLDTAAAVHDASLAMLRGRRAQRQSTHPFYWAGFVAVGDWR